MRVFPGAVVGTIDVLCNANRTSSLPIKNLLASNSKTKVAKRGSRDLQTKASIHELTSSPSNRGPSRAPISVSAGGGARAHEYADTVFICERPVLYSSVRVEREFDRSFRAAVALVCVDIAKNLGFAGVISLCLLNEGRNVYKIQ